MDASRASHPMHRISCSPGQADHTPAGLYWPVDRGATDDRTAAVGIVTLIFVGRPEFTADNLCQYRNVLSACLLLPEIEGLRPSCSMKIDTHQVSAGTEVTVNKCVGGKELLSLFWRSESLHLAFARLAKVWPNSLDQRRTVSWDTTTPRSARSSSTSRSLRLNT
jgi:hypothetical protein